eukprot:226520-Pelagomonas_calceolata.AAC.2
MIYESCHGPGLDDIERGAKSGGTASDTNCRSISASTTKGNNAPWETSMMAQTHEKCMEMIPLPTLEPVPAVPAPSFTGWNDQLV